MEKCSAWESNGHESWLFTLHGIVVGHALPVFQVINLHESSMNGDHSAPSVEASSQEDAECDDEVIDISSEDGSPHPVIPAHATAGPSNCSIGILITGHRVVPLEKPEGDADHVLHPPILTEDEDDKVDVVISDSEDPATIPNPADDSPTGRARDAAALPAPAHKPAERLSNQGASLAPAEFHHTWPCTPPAAREAHLPVVSKIHRCIEEDFMEIIVLGGARHDRGNSGP